MSNTLLHMRLLGGLVGSEWSVISLYPGVYRCIYIFWSLGAYMGACLVRGSKVFWGTLGYLVATNSTHPNWFTIDNFFASLLPSHYRGKIRNLINCLSRKCKLFFFISSMINYTFFLELQSTNKLESKLVSFLKILYNFCCCCCCCIVKHHQSFC